MVYGTYNYSIHGVYKPSYNWGAPPCRNKLSSQVVVSPKKGAAAWFHPPPHHRDALPGDLRAAARRGRGCLTTTWDNGQRWEKAEESMNNR